MSDIFEDVAEEMDQEQTIQFIIEFCPECGTELSIHQGRCLTCPECGWSLCGL